MLLMLEKSIRFVFATVGSFLLGICPAFAQEETDNLLERLVGTWAAEGHLLGAEVSYNVEAEFVLEGSFLLLSLTDAADPPQYDSMIFIGRSASHGDYIAHWLDTTGADGARVVGFGEGEVDRLTLTFHYEGGDFRDVFDFQDDGTIQFAVDQASDVGEWVEFARYVFFPAVNGRK